MTCDSDRHAQRGDAKQAPSEADLWRPIQGYEGRYSVSRDGRVFSHIRDLEMKPVANSSGYATVQLQARRHRVHRLVCAAFNGPPNALHRHVAHLNGDKTDNRADNLKWVSPAENDSHKDRHGTRQSGANHPRAKLTQEQVDEIRRSPESGAQLARRFGVNKEAISKVRLGHRWGQSGGATSAASPNLQQGKEDTVEELVNRLEARLGYNSGHLSQWVSNSETIVRKDDLRVLIAIAKPRPQSTVTEEMIGAGEAIIERMSSTYRARNGRQMSIQGDDGEMCWIVHSDDIETLRHALSKVSPLG